MTPRLARHGANAFLGGGNIGCGGDLKRWWIDGERRGPGLGTLAGARIGDSDGGVIRVGGETVCACIHREVLPNSRTELASTTGWVIIGRARGGDVCAWAEGASTAPSPKTANVTAATIAISVGPNVVLDMLRSKTGHRPQH